MRSEPEGSPVAAGRWRAAWGWVRRVWHPPLDLSPDGEARWRRQQRRAVWAIVLLTLAVVAVGVLAGLYARKAGPDAEAYVTFSFVLVLGAVVALTVVAQWAYVNRRRRLSHARGARFRARVREVERERRRRDVR